jgi:hypothetical protein
MSPFWFDMVPYVVYAAYSLAVVAVIWMLWHGIKHEGKYLFLCSETIFAAILFFFWILPLSMYSILPSPGMAVVMMAIAAGIMSCQPEALRGRHQAVWIVILCLFAYMEIRSIDADRAVHEKEQAEARATHDREFRATTSDLQKTITKETDAVGVLRKIIESNKRIENKADTFLTEEHDTHLKVLALSAKGTGLSTSLKAWLNIADRVSSTMRGFGQEWQFADNQLELPKWEELHRNGPPLSANETALIEGAWDVRIADMNDRYRHELGATVQDAMQVQQVLLSYMPSEDQTTADRSQREVLAQMASKMAEVRQYFQCPPNLPAIAGYLEDLAKRVQNTSGN